MEKYIKRAIREKFLSKMLPNKVMVLLGARRVGKTSFLENFIKDNISEPVLELNGEDISTSEVLSQRSVENYKRLLGKKNILIIDEAQKIPNIGQILKLMVDNIDGIKIIATGSSMFDLSNQLGEPLTGRKVTFNLYPLAQMEYSEEENLIQTKSKLEERLIYGSYPELIHYDSNEEKSAYLKDLVNSYLLKDILEYDGIKSSSKMINLLRLVAFQIGKEVSLEELGKQLGLSRNTVEKYLDLLEKVFVIYKVSGFSRNLRKEITKTSRWYFFDNGIRNTLIANFNPIILRNDVGELWENYILSERIKYQNYTGMIVNNYFWRTYSQQEIDWIEEREGNLFAYEIKWRINKKVKIPKEWKDTYSQSQFLVITPENYFDFIT
ncbi:MAG TPA: ATPase [Bacteroidales bacterium]|nr:MAG: ATPase [Bacteroidetes bacterium GWF2_33_38]OFY85344.1 MAG: ATPase [Bacteroidetes bacterium RIFOXYA2_FULL_33_7]HBF89274.1 ATPase [Bacteroidales bacterium]